MTTKSKWRSVARTGATVDLARMEREAREKQLASADEMTVTVAALVALFDALRAARDEVAQREARIAALAKDLADYRRHQPLGHSAGAYAEWASRQR